MLMPLVATDLAVACLEGARVFNICFPDSACFRRPIAIETKLAVTGNSAISMPLEIAGTLGAEGQPGEIVPRDWAADAQEVCRGRYYKYCIVVQ